MAVDEALLKAAIDRNECVLRLYRWSEATVSLGYFQKAEAETTSSELTRLPWVRRLSGGGAILHHHELTYSCVVPALHELARSHQDLYECVHTRIITLLRKLDIPARMRGTARDQQQQPFLCFGREDPRDLILKDRKILGSAQRRRRGAILQHGSLLLKCSQHAPQHPGLWDLCGRWKLEQQLTQAFAAEVGSLLGEQAVHATLTDEDRRCAEVLQHQRYATLEWKKTDAGKKVET